MGLEQIYKIDGNEHNKHEQRIFSVKAANGTADIVMYAPIGEDYYGGVSASEFAGMMQTLGGIKTINLRLNSPGGEVNAGYAIYTLLVAHPATVNVYIDGEAASIASVIAMAGDKIEISANGTVMIHKPWTIAAGNDDEFEELVSTLRLHGENIAKTYAARTKLSIDDVKGLMKASTTMAAEQALELGFVDRIGERKAIAAMKLMPSVVRALGAGTPQPQEPLKPTLESIEQMIAERKARYRQESTT